MLVNDYWICFGFWNISQTSKNKVKGSFSNDLFQMVSSAQPQDDLWHMAMAMIDKQWACIALYYRCIVYI